MPLFDVQKPKEVVTADGWGVVLSKKTQKDIVSSKVAPAFLADNVCIGARDVLMHVYVCESSSGTAPLLLIRQRGSSKVMLIDNAMEYFVCYVCRLPVPYHLTMPHQLFHISQNKEKKQKKEKAAPEPKEEQRVVCKVATILLPRTKGAAHCKVQCGPFSAKNTQSQLDEHTRSRCNLFGLALPALFGRHYLKCAACLTFFSKSHCIPSLWAWGSGGLTQCLKCSSALSKQTTVGFKVQW